MSEPTDDLETAAVGAAAGAASTVAMSVLMLAAQRAGLLGEMPPHDITYDVVEQTPLRDDLGHHERGVLGWVVHFGFGAATGALFAVLRRHAGRELPAPVAGSAFGLAVWTVSYLGWVPALGFMPRANEDRPGRPPVMIAAHLVFGGLLGMIVDAARPRDRA